MNLYLVIAGVLCNLLGIAHSILGEVLIFHRKREKDQIVPTITGGGLAEKHLRIIWASWHLLSILGWAIGAVLIMLGTDLDLLTDPMIRKCLTGIKYAMLTSSLLVLYATRGKHPGWFVLLVIGVLIWVS